MCKSVFFVSFQSLKTVVKSFRVLEMSLNLTKTCMYEPCVCFSEIKAHCDSKGDSTETETGETMDTS